MTARKLNVDPVIVERMRTKYSPLADRFEHKFIPEPTSGCWLWIGKVRDGYGRIRSAQRWEAAHRVSWRIYRGPIPDGRLLCHKCDTRCCVNPTHLYVGTTLDNMADLFSRGQPNRARGSGNGNARLTETDVVAIRASTETQLTLARRFGVGQSVISSVRRRETWRHIP